jgi:UDPglucose 6-dehydrogenase
MNVSVVGTGHVGLVACASFAEIGHRVIGVDEDAEKIALLRRGVAPFYEPGLLELLERNSANGRLSFTSDFFDAVKGAEVVFICVGTPARATGEANLLAVERVARQIAKHMDDGSKSVVLVQKSTVPAGTADRIRRAVRLENRAIADRLEVVSNPEFLREGRAVQDSLEPDRILVGADSVHASEAMRQLYRPLTDKGCRYIETDIKTAEIAKHACNAFLALKISYANALARLCELTNADVVQIADIMGADPRIGRPFLDAGLGFGGYCLPKDIQAFERLAAGSGYDFPILREVERINKEALEAALNKIREAIWNLEDKRIALLGLSFKPGTDDIRFAPALALARRLLSEKAIVVGYDPEAASNAKEEVADLEIALDPYQAVDGAHCLVVCTEWPEFKELDLARVARTMAFPLVVDGRNLFSRREMAAAGFVYLPIGRPPVDFEAFQRGSAPVDQTVGPA